jgi:Zn-dependent protease/CBS domain-containing protein
VSSSADSRLVRRRSDGGLHLVRIAGIDVTIHWSLLIIFALIAGSLGVGLFPAWHPNWGAVTTWVTSLAAAVLFLLSILVHELSHALVGRAQGIEVKTITLFMFGGVAHLDREPQAWSPELWMALVGPLTSLAIGVVCTALGYVAAGGAFSSMAESPEQALSALGPGATLLFWLGPVNIILALFNLVPGFPLDGGRVLRAILWGSTGNLRLATRWASRGGRMFAWLLMLSGVAMAFGFHVPVFGTGFGNGLWLILIGWFLHNAAAASYQQLLIQQALRDMPVSKLTHTSVESVSPDTPIRFCVDEFFVKHEREICPVTQQGRLLGVVDLPSVRRLGRERWDAVTAADVMTRVDDVASVAPDTSCADALGLMNRLGLNQLPVVRDGKLGGVVRRDDLLRWLYLYGEGALAG